MVRDMGNFYSDELLASHQPPSWRNTPYRLSVSGYLIYWDLASVVMIIRDEISGENVSSCQNLNRFQRKILKNVTPCSLVEIFRNMELTY